MAGGTITPKVGTTQGLQQTPTTAKAKAPKQGRGVGGTKPSFFKGFGQGVAKAFRSVGRAVGALPPKVPKQPATTQAAQTTQTTVQPTTTQATAKTATSLPPEASAQPKPGEVLNSYNQAKFDSYQKVKADFGQAKTDFAAAKSEFDALKKADDANPTPSNPQLASAKKDMDDARQVMTDAKKTVDAAWKDMSQGIKAQFRETDVYKAALAEPNQKILHSDDYGSSPKVALDAAISSVLMDTKPERLEEVVKRGMKIEDAASINLYTTQAYKGLNENLRSGSPSKFASAVESSIMEGMKKLDEPKGVMYRVVSIPEKFDHLYQVDQIVKPPGITSTTQNAIERFEGGWQSHHITIAQAFESAGRDVMWLSSQPKENESIYPPGTEFRILSRDNPNTPKDTGKKDEQGKPIFDFQVHLILVEIEADGTGRTRL